MFPVVPVDPVLTVVLLSRVIDRCAGGERDVEEENLRGNSVRLHQTRLGSSKVILHSVFTVSFLSLLQRHTTCYTVFYSIPPKNTKFPLSSQ